MNKKIKRSIIIIYFILLFAVFMTSAFSKNITTINKNATLDSAQIVFEVDKTTEKIVNASNTQQGIYFSVKNSTGVGEEQKINEIEYTYNLEIVSENNLPLEYELFKIENGKETKINVNKGKTENITMKHTDLQEDKFVLKVKMNDKSKKNIDDMLNIDVYAVQSV